MTGVSPALRQALPGLGLLPAEPAAGFGGAEYFLGDRGTFAQAHP